MDVENNQVLAYKYFPQKAQNGVQENFIFQGINSQKE